MNSVFRVYIYPPGYAAFAGRDLTPGDYIEKYPDGFLFEVSGASYSTTPIELICTDASSGQQRWKISTSGSVRRWPVFFQPDLMIFEAGWGTASTLAAVNTAAGNILWQTPRDIASNFVVQGNAVYSIDINGVLTTRDAVDGREVLTQVEKLQPDVLLLDLSMPQLSGWNVLRRLAKSTMDVRVILLPATIEGGQAVEALRLGARGWLPKSTASQLLYKSIRTVMAGEYWVDHGTVRDLVNTYRTSAESASKAAQIAKYNLTRRELEILSSVVDGCTNKDIATQFKISEQTVKHHLTSIFEKVGVSNRLELALFAMNQNLVA